MALVHSEVQKGRNPAYIHHRFAQGLAILAVPELLAAAIANMAPD